MASFVSSIKRKLASILPFPIATNDELNIEAAIVAASEEVDHNRPRKRQRLHHDSAAGTATPHLLSESTPFNPPPTPTQLNFSSKHFLSHDSLTSNRRSSNQPSALLRLLPNDVLSHCFSYVNTCSDRYGLQVTCTTFRKLSNEDDMLASIDLGGDCAAVTNVYSPFDGLENAVQQHGGPVAAVGNEVAVEPAAAAVAEGDNENDDEGNPTGETARIALQPTPPAAGGIILYSDTSITACTKLVKFAVAGNMQATYMIAMILCYCHENISEGLALLRHSATHPNTNGHHHLPSIYALALILRDSHQTESDHYLNKAASLGYAPAWQEKLTATEMRAQFGDLDASKLVQYLDPVCLNRLLGRHYLECRRVKKKHQTSHCWNPLCGRWAYKALRVENNPRRVRLARLRAYLNEQVGGVGGDQQQVGAADNDRDMQQLLELARANHENEGNRNNIRAASGEGQQPPSSCCQQAIFSIESLLPPPVPAANNAMMSYNPTGSSSSSEPTSPLEQIREALRNKKPQLNGQIGLKVSRMKMCSSCRRAKYCSKLCQVYDWRSGRHKMECQFL